LKSIPMVKLLLWSQAMSVVEKPGRRPNRKAPGRAAL
jgi:hypothetical protein